MEDVMESICLEIITLSVSKARIEDSATSITSEDLMDSCGFDVTKSIWLGDSTLSVWLENVKVSIWLEGLRI
jgi:hypothetical protein